MRVILDAGTTLSIRHGSAAGKLSFEEKNGTVFVRADIPMRSSGDLEPEEARPRVSLPKKTGIRGSKLPEVDLPVWVNAPQLSEADAERLMKVVLGLLGLDVEPQAEDKMADLWNDSLDLVETCLAIEEEFDLEIQDSWIEAVVTYADLQKCVSFCLSR